MSTTTNPTSRLRMRRLIGAVLVALAAGALLGACGDDTEGVAGESTSPSTTRAVEGGDNDNNDDNDNSDRKKPVSTTVPAGGEGQEAGSQGTSGQGASGQGGGQPVSPPPGGGQSGGGQSSGSQSGGGQGGGGNPPSTPPPAILSFVTPENIDCHNDMFQQFTASWTTQGAAEVTISIDGPGIYDTYPANGETSLPFNCNSPHTFLLTAKGSDGQTATKQITLHPRNVQTEDPADDEQ